MENYLIFGLGNPGPNYKNTRHNIGQIFLEKLFYKLENRNFNDTAQNNKKLKVVLAKFNYKNSILYFAKSALFMNESGESLKKTIDYFKINPENILIIQDDVDIKFDKIKMSSDSTSAGHKGIQSIIDNIKTKNFYRARIGIWNLDRKKSQKLTEKYVMGNFNKSEFEILNKIIFPEFLKIFEKFITKTN